MKRMGMGPYLQADETGDMRIGDAQPAPLFKQEEEGLATKKSPPPSFENKKHGQEGAGVGMGIGAGGGTLYQLSKQGKEQDRVATSLERTGFGTGMSIAGY